MRAIWVELVKLVQSMLAGWLVLLALRIDALTVAQMTGNAPPPTAPTTEGVR